MKIIKKPKSLKALGSPPKKISEYIGRVNTKTPAISIARMKSPAGWIERGQTPEFEEFSLVLKGTLRVTTRHLTCDIKAGQTVIMPGGTWVQYSTPKGAEYISVCMPAFSKKKAHRDK